MGNWIRNEESLRRRDSTNNVEQSCCALIGNGYKAAQQRQIYDDLGIICSDNSPIRCSKTNKKNLIEEDVRILVGAPVRSGLETIERRRIGDKNTITFKLHPNTAQLLILWLLSCRFRVFCLRCRRVSKICIWTWSALLCPSICL